MTDYVFDRTNRGFRIIEFLDRYGKSSSIQESSLASEACIWIGQSPDRIHLTQDDARIVADILMYFHEIGELPDSLEALQS